MRRWIALVATFYPRSWREEFGDEFDALLDDVKPGWRVFGDVLGGAIMMQISEGTNWMKLVAATAVAGALIAGGASYTVERDYESSASVSVTPQPDPVRPTSPQALQEWTAGHIAEMETEILSRSELSVIINDPRLQLYKDELQRMPVEDVIEKMRRNIRIQVRPLGDGDLSPVVMNISFSYPDPIKAQATVRVLAGKFAEANAFNNKVRGDVYRGFWQDWQAKAAFDRTKTASIPPPPVGETVEVLHPASLSGQSAGPNRIVFLAWGLGVGLLLGVLAALGARWPRRVVKLTGFALTGCILAGAASYLLPSRYVSSGVMEVLPAAITEDPAAPLPSATPAIEFLRRTEPEVLDSGSLARIIQDPRLNLYPNERGEKPIEAAVQEMRDHLHIAEMSTTTPSHGRASAFSITFTYSDPFLAQHATQMLMNRFDEVALTQQMNAPRATLVLRQIYQRKAGENLDVVDPPSLPMSPVWPNRRVIAGIGFGTGLLIGVITLRLRRTRRPGLQPA